MDLMMRAAGFQDAGDGYLFLPQWMLDMRMVKKPWGWDRVSTVLTNSTQHHLSQEGVRELFDLLPEDLAIKLNFVAKHVYHYPVLQIVDGNGNRTEHYETYLKSVNKVP